MQKLRLQWPQQRIGSQNSSVAGSATGVFHSFRSVPSSVLEYAQHVQAVWSPSVIPKLLQLSREKMPKVQRFNCTSIPGASTYPKSLSQLPLARNTNKGSIVETKSPVLKNQKQIWFYLTSDSTADLRSMAGVSLKQKDSTSVPLKSQWDLAD